MRRVENSIHGHDRDEKKRKTNLQEQPFESDAKGKEENK